MSLFLLFARASLKQRHLAEASIPHYPRSLDPRKSSNCTHSNHQESFAIQHIIIKSTNRQSIKRKNINMIDQHDTNNVPTMIKVSKPTNDNNRISELTDGAGICKVELIRSLLEQIKTKDEQLSSKDERIANLEDNITSLEEKIVNMSLELASSKALQDENWLMMQYKLQEAERSLQQQQVSLPSSRSNSLSRSWNGVLEGLGKEQHQQQDQQESTVSSCRYRAPIDATKRRHLARENSLMASMPNLGSILGLNRRQSDSPSGNTSSTESSNSSNSSSSILDQQPSQSIGISKSIIERVRRRSSLLSHVEWPEN